MPSAGPRVETQVETADMVVDTHASWWVFSAPAGPGESLSRPGLWKRADTAGRLLAFDVPAGKLELTRDDMPALVAWARACLDGTILDGTVRPTHASADVPHVEAGRLTARVGTFTCTGEVVAREGRLYVDFPLGTVPEGLPPAARQWLAAMLEAARRLRMVRVETCSDSGAIHARVDLTGAPAAWLPGLLDEAVLCLRAVVERLLPGITFLTTAGVKCQALEPATPAITTTQNQKQQEQQKEKKHP